MSPLTWLVGERPALCYKHFIPAGFFGAQHRCSHRLQLPPQPFHLRFAPALAHLLDRLYRTNNIFLLSVFL